MAVRDILLHLDNRATCPDRIDLAIRLARAHGAVLTGLYVTDLPFFSRHQPRPDEGREAARAAFSRKAREAGIETEWIAVDSSETGLGTTELVNLHGHYRDVVILGQTGPGRDPAVPADLPERAVLGAGRPVLIAPYASDLETVGRRVLLAWRGGPESSRAVHDALPLLQAARAVTVLAVKTPDAEGEFGPAGGDLVAHLGRHGVEATFEEVDPRGLAVGDMLLNRAADLGSDLLVMGAFAQSRRGIPGLGEVGRHLLKYMTVPVLMSH